MPEEHRLAQSLSWPHLVALGVGAIVGTGILTLIGVGAGKAGPGGHPVLRHRRRDLRLRRAGLCRGRDDDPGVGLGLHLFLCRVRRADRVDDRRRADPRIYFGGERGRGRLVGLCGGLSEIDRPGLARRSDPGARAGRDHQPAGDLHHLGRRRPADRRDARKRDAQRHPGASSRWPRWHCSSRSRCRCSTRPTSIRSCRSASRAAARREAKSA